jgi:hypothetical protein
MTSSSLVRLSRSTSYSIAAPEGFVDHAASGAHRLVDRCLETPKRLAKGFIDAAQKRPAQILGVAHDQFFDL